MASIPEIFRRLYIPGPINLYCVNINCQVNRDKQFIVRRLSEVLRTPYWCDVCGNLLSEGESWRSLLELYCWSNFCIQWFLIGWASIIGKDN